MSPFSKQSLYILMLLISLGTNAQTIPDLSENIDFLVTFSKEAEKDWGDDDFNQTFFIAIPENNKNPFFIRVFDPEIGGMNDDIKKFSETVSKTKFSIYGGNGTYSDPDARGVDPVGNYKSGNLFVEKTFGNEVSYDNKWYSFGPFNPVEGEYIPEMKAYIFKIIAEGISGKDGNLYKYFISSTQESNEPIEGANAFTFEYTFRLQSKPNSVAFLYPFIGKDVISIKIHSFDFDNDGQIVLQTVKKNRHVIAHSDQGWALSEHFMEFEEKNKSAGIQIVKKSAKDNDMVIFITNQYNKPIPFYTLPIGGSPKYKYHVNVQYVK